MVFGPIESGSVGEVPVFETCVPFTVTRAR